MKTWPAFAVLLVLAVVPSRAEDNDKVATLSGEIEVSQLERDVDKELLREAMMLVGRARMRGASSEETKMQLQILEEFVQAKKIAVIKRTADLKSKTSELAAATQEVTQPNPPLKPSDDKDRQGLIEKMAEAEVEIQLLQIQSEMYQQKLTEILNELATAEFAARGDETQRVKAEAARKRFNRFKAKYVECIKQFQNEREKVADLRKRTGLGGIGVMGGMGGGMR